MLPTAPSVYQRQSGLILAFHGCDRSTGERVLSANGGHLDLSKNAYDWLGEGIYFWENDPQRAYEFACEAAQNGKVSKGKIKDPFVIGAVIDLGLCLNLLERRALDELGLAFRLLQAAHQTGKPFPQNAGKDRKQRFLDAAVINMVHQLRQSINGRMGNIPQYQTIRGAFWEGEPAYQGAEFFKESHIQIAVRDLSCIKAYFRPLPGI